MYDYAKHHRIRKVVIQPHPNTGHRSYKYILYLLEGVKYLQKRGLDIRLIHWSSQPLTKFLFSSYLQEKQKENISVKVAFCDISAMELQFMDKDIPTFIFENKIKNTKPKSELLQEYNRRKTIDFTNIDLHYDMNLHYKVKDFYIEKNKQSLF